MKFFLTKTLLVLAGLFTLTGERAFAQVGALPPPVSPWLLLGNRGLSPAINYTNLYRPQIDISNTALGLQQQVTANQQGLYNAQMLLTGHPTRFLNTGGYFMSSGGGGAYRGGPGGYGNGGGGPGGYGYGGGGYGGYGYGGGGYGGYGYGGGGLGGYGYGGGGLGGYGPGALTPPLPPTIPAVPR